MGSSTIESIKLQTEMDLERIVGEIVREHLREFRSFLKTLRTETHRPWITATLTDDRSLSARYLPSSKHPHRAYLQRIYDLMLGHTLYRENVARNLGQLASKYKSPHFIVLDIDFILQQKDGRELPDNEPEVVVPKRSVITALSDADRIFLKGLRITPP